MSYDQRLCIKNMYKKLVYKDPSLCAISFRATFVHHLGQEQWLDGVRGSQKFHFTHKDNKQQHFHKKTVEEQVHVCRAYKNGIVVCGW